MISKEEFYKEYTNMSTRFDVFATILYNLEREQDLESLLEEYSPDDAENFDETCVYLNGTPYFIYSDEEESNILSESGESAVEDAKWEVNRSCGHLESYINWDKYREDMCYDDICEYYNYTFLGSQLGYSVYEE